jgi:hypothetical protein
MRQKNFSLAITLIFCFILATSLFSCLYTVKAGTVTISTYVATLDIYQPIYANHPSTNSTVSAFGESFTAIVDGYVSLVKLNLKRGAGISAAANARCAIYSITGTYGTNSTPNILLGKSTTTINQNSLLTSAAYYDFVFNGTLFLETGEHYALALEMEDSLDYSGYIAPGYDNTGPTYDGNAFNYISTGWGNSAGIDLVFTVYGSETPLIAPESSLYYTFSVTNANYSILPDFVYPDITLIEKPMASINQLASSVYLGQVTNNTVPYLAGNFSVYKTVLYYGSLDNTSWINASRALDQNAVTFSSIGQIMGGYTRTGLYYADLGFDITQEYHEGSGETYRGYRINGTIEDSGEVFSSDFVLEALEPTFRLVGQMSGGHFGNSLNTIGLTAPLEFGLFQRSVYIYHGTVYKGLLVNGTGNFSLWSGGLLTSYSSTTYYAYTSVSNGTFGNGTFSFSLSSRQASQDLHEPYKIIVTLDSGVQVQEEYVWFWSDDVSPLQSPGYTTQPGVIDADQTNTVMTNMVSIIILLLVVGGPALILGGAAGLPGLVVGGIFGLGIAVMANLIPFWFILLAGSGLVAAFLMWRRNNGQ